MTDVIAPMPLFDPLTRQVPEAVQERLAAFAEKWLGKVGNEQQLAQPFLLELCQALGTPSPTDGVLPPDDYCFERQVQPAGAAPWRIDLYKRGHFVLEAKCGRNGRSEPGSAPVRGTRHHVRYIEEAYTAQARVYANLLPGGGPPALVVVDVGHHLWLWCKRADGSYPAFNDPDRIDIPLQRFADPEAARWLVALFDHPSDLDLSRFQARVTEEVAADLAPVAASLQARFPNERVSRFLMRCLFCMFAEDVELLPRDHFRKLLKTAIFRPDAFPRECEKLFTAMRDGTDYDWEPIRPFNGALFSETEALPLTGSELHRLASAAAKDWSRVEPSIFGTLLERALSATKRKALGAHYTPRAFVERLVQPTIGEPLRQEWELTVRAPAERLLDEAEAATNPSVAKKKRNEAGELVDKFLDRLAQVKVLDPACGTANFLYVAYATLRALEFEALSWRFDHFGHAQGAMAMQGRGVAVSQLIGMEVDAFAAEIAQLVLWIGHLQWEVRYRGLSAIGKPVIPTRRSIEHRDAVLASDPPVPRLDADGQPVTRWEWGAYLDATTHKGLVPDPNARVPVLDYPNPRQAPWPEADFIIGNPPFIGNKMMRDRLGDGYAEALRRVYGEVDATVDFVMYWWHRAAEAARGGRVRRFGFITTNSLKQTFNRGVLTAALEGERPMRLVYAIPDHPWTDDGADVRIAMTVAEPAPEGPAEPPLIGEVIAEDAGHEAVEVANRRVPRLHADLSHGADLTSARPLRANAGLSFQGMNLVGKGFRLEPAEVEALGFRLDALPPIIKPYLNAREMMQKREGRYVIDAFGLTEAELKAQWPTAWQWLHDRVKPERELNRDPKPREFWWLFGRPREALRAVWTGLGRFIMTPETSKHRVFAWAPMGVVPDHSLYVVTLADDYTIGVLQSRCHETYSLAAGSRLVDRPRWRNVTCFLTFPFPDASPAQRAAIADTADTLIAFREAAQARSPELTLTAIYNLLAARRAGEKLTGKQAKLHTLLATDELLSLHDRLDAAVLAAYGWPADLGEDALLERLLALNHARVAEEASGLVRWLRPELAATAEAPVEAEAEPEEAEPTEPEARAEWPSDPGDQYLSVYLAIAGAAAPMDVESVAARFERAPRKQVAAVFEQLVKLHRVVVLEDGRVRA